SVALFLALVFAWAMLAAVSAEPRAGRANVDWPQFHFVPTHLGYNPFETILGPSTVQGLQLDWSAPLGGVIVSSPAVVGGVLYIGTLRGHAAAIDAATGTVLWDTPIGDTVTSSPAVSGGLVYLGAFDSGDVSALHADTGTAAW